MIGRNPCARVLIGILVLSATTTTLAAQQPVPGLRLHLQVMSADTAVKSLGSLGSKLAKIDMNLGYAFTKCLPPEPGQRKRANPACGPDLRNAAVTVLAEQTVTTDAQGHALQRLSSPDGEAAVEVEAAEYIASRSGDRVRLKVGFWPALAPGQPAEANAAERSSMILTLDHTLLMTVMTPRGATILSLRAEMPGTKPPGARRD